MLTCVLSVRRSRTIQVLRRICRSDCYSSTVLLNINGGAVLDCGYVKSIALHSDIKTVSMRSLFSHSSTLPNDSKSSASMFFIKKLSDYIKADKLTYLVPDWVNDFDLEVIRKSVNFYFDDSTPLPKSIAAIFAWQSSKKFVQGRIKERDFVLAVDSFDDGISITPVQAIYQKELDEILPETQGISWERHPTVIISNRGIQTAIVAILTVMAARHLKNSSICSVSMVWYQ